MAGQRCPECKHRFQVLDDEEGMHECPSCGYFPGRDDADDNETEDEDAIEQEIANTERAVEDGQARWAETGSTKKQKR